VIDILPATGDVTITALASDKVPTAGSADAQAQTSYRLLLRVEVPGIASSVQDGAAIFRMSSAMGAIA